MDGDELALSVLVIGELRLGVHRIRRRDGETAGHLALWLGRLEETYRDRILPVDPAVVGAWAEINAPRPLPVIDSLQAATALVHGMTFVTRNVGDLEGVAVPLLDPFLG